MPSVNIKMFEFKGKVSQDFCFWFFHESVSPQPQSIPIGPFRIFQKFAEIFASQGAPPVSRTTAAKFAPVSLVLLIPVANLPPLSTIAAANNGNNIRLLIT